MKKSEFKNPNAKATRRQTWAIYCMAKEDVRDNGLTRWEASQIISTLKDGGNLVLPHRVIEPPPVDEVKYNKVIRPFEVKKKKRVPTMKKKHSDAVRLFDAANEAGRKAMEKITPTPMVVQQRANVLDDNSAVKKEWTVPGGVCGFAWVVIKCKGKGIKFINGLKKAGIAGGENSHCTISKSSYHKGFYYHIHEGGQSYEYKQAFADAFAKHLKKHEIECYSGSRLD